MNTLTLRGVKKVCTTTIERESAGAEGPSMIEYDSQTIIVDMASGDIFVIELFFAKKGEKK